MGGYRGSLAGIRPDDLAAHVVSAAVERNGIDPSRIDDVYMGAANQSGEDNRDVARMAALLAGLPVDVPGVTVNRLCASGLEAVNQASRALRLGDGRLREAFKLASEHHVSLLEVNKVELDRLTQGAVHQGLDDMRGEVVGADPGEPTAVPTHRSSEGIDDQRLRHGR